MYWEASPSVGGCLHYDMSTFPSDSVILLQLSDLLLHFFSGLVKGFLNA